ncbi:DUF507 family protein [bacterium]|nr:DUF507 family protein [bacterium]
MKLSDDRINYISHQILDKIRSKLDFEEEARVLRTVKDGFYGYQKIEEAIDSKVCQKIESLKRVVQRGSSEWEALYRQYFNEELTKSGLC